MRLLVLLLLLLLLLGVTVGAPEVVWDGAFSDLTSDFVLCKN